MERKNEPLKEWFSVDDISAIDSPALAIYYNRVVENIRIVKSMIDDVKRLRPHIKTNKSKEACLLMIEAGIAKFKCASISEAEMLAMINAADVLLAYQPFGPKLNRLITLIKTYPATTFSCLVDNLDSAKGIAKAALENNLQINVYIDLNIGMNRTGIAPGAPVLELYRACNSLQGVKPVGLHVYDGHIRCRDFKQRAEECDKAFQLVEDTQSELVKKGFQKPVIIAGGSPTFPIHAERKDVECSPGTFIYWDDGYQQSCPEQYFLPAALVISRIISLPAKNIICLDLGHKSIASENDLAHRVVFLNASNLKFIGHSEEHLIAEVPDGHAYKIGDVFYGLPVHICPTVALYERASVVKDHETAGEWKIIARDRKIII